ncbi:10325_t:CDS:2 [Entrophospora sp. SA101]|nr:10325_t:CDS:2 [Entrophospora sp. SA101]
MSPSRRKPSITSSSSETSISEETRSIESDQNSKKFDSTNTTYSTTTIDTTAAKLSLTCNFGDLPAWLQDNKDILRGYRRPTLSYIKCAKSLFYLHNESGFYCNGLLQIIYLTSISIFGAATISVAVASKFRSPEFRWFRTGMFLSMGLSAIVPLAHALILYGPGLCFDVISLKWLLLMGALYVVGALIYGASA